MRGKQTLTFSVTACQPVTVILAVTLKHPSDDSYRIVLGGDANTLASIYRYGSDTAIASVIMDHVLNCERHNLFWISWGARILNMGHGPHVGQSSFLTFDDSTTSSDDLEVISCESEDIAMWQLEDFQGNIFLTNN